MCEFALYNNTLKKTSFTSVVTEAILVKFSIHPHMLCVFLTIFSQTNIKQNKSDRTWDSFTWLQKKKIIKLKKIKKRKEIMIWQIEKMWCTAFGPCYISDSHNTFTWQDINHSSFIFYTDGWWRWFWCSQNTLIKLIHLTQSAVLFLHEKWETDLVPFISS